MEMERNMKAKNIIEKRNLRSKNRKKGNHKAAEFEKKQLSRSIITGKVKSSVFISEETAVQTCGVEIQIHSFSMSSLDVASVSLRPL
jgi:hypothetical protein